MLNRGVAIREAESKSIRVIGSRVDITERKRAEEAVRVANEQLDLAIRGSNIGVWDVDLVPGSDYRRGPVRFINVWEQLGYDPAEFPTDASASRALAAPGRPGASGCAPSRRVSRAKRRRSGWRTGSGTRTGPTTGSSRSAGPCATRREGLSA